MGVRKKRFHTVLGDIDRERLDFLAQDAEASAAHVLRTLIKNAYAMIQNVDRVCANGTPCPYKGDLYAPILSKPQSLLLEQPPTEETPPEKIRHPQKKGASQKSRP